MPDDKIFQKIPSDKPKKQNISGGDGLAVFVSLLVIAAIVGTSNSDELIPTPIPTKNTEHHAIESPADTILMYLNHGHQK